MRRILKSSSKIYNSYSGRWGIRTPGTLYEFICLVDRCFKPLSQPSIVVLVRFELTTSRVSDECSNQLSYKTIKISLYFVDSVGLEPTTHWLRVSYSTNWAKNLFGAENGTQTRDPQLGRLALYQLSYFRIRWTVWDSNSWPLACKANVLANWTNSPFSSGGGIRTHVSEVMSLVSDLCWTPQ